MNSFFFTLSLLFSSHFFHSPLRHPHNLQESAEIKQANPGDCDRKYVSFLPFAGSDVVKKKKVTISLCCHSEEQFFLLFPLFSKKENSPNNIPFLSDEL